MKKLIPLLVIFVFILSGCSSEYNLEISNSKIKENIKVEILDADIPKEIPGIDVDLNDRITPFIQNDQHPIFNNEEIKYKKKVTKVGDLTKVNLSYTYTHDQFRNSNTFKTCFEKASFMKTRQGYDLDLSGSFYCLYGDSIKINIKTNNVVIGHNADKVSGNVYTWTINDNNVKDVNIHFSISKKTKTITTILYVVAAIIFIALAVFAYRFYKQYKEKDSVNDL